jgi:hypothetical protein
MDGLVRYSVLFPDATKHPVLDQQIIERQEQWRQQKQAAEQSFELHNVLFRHDPHWNTRFWSIQCAHDQEHWGWVVVSYLFAASLLSGVWLHIIATLRWMG